MTTYSDIVMERLRKICVGLLRGGYDYVCVKCRGKFRKRSVAHYEDKGLHCSGCCDFPSNSNPTAGSDIIDSNEFGFYPTCSYKMDHLHDGLMEDEEAKLQAIHQSRFDTIATWARTTTM